MYKDFIKKYLVFTVIALIVTGIPVYFFIDKHLQVGFLGNFLLFFILVLVSGIILIRSLSKDSSNFQTYTLAAIFIKMILAVIYFYFVFASFKEDLILFVGSFFFSYLLFTIFEVSFLVRYLRKKTDS